MMKTSRTQHACTPPLSEKLHGLLLDLIQHDKLDLPLLPEVAGQVMSMSFDESSNARKLSELIQRDQSMAGHLLRLANSPMYMPSVRIVSVQQAVARLGMRTIREIAIVISCEGKVFRVKGYEKEVRALYRHSLAAAAYAQEIARMQRRNVEEAFLCGLLHDVGKPVLLQALVDIQKRHKITMNHKTIHAAVDEFHHTVGSRLTENWSLPARLAETILFHHQPMQAPSCSKTAMMTHLANSLAHYTIGPKRTDEAALRSHPMLSPLNIYPDQMDALLAKKDAIGNMVKVIA